MERDKQAELEQDRIRSPDINFIPNSVHKSIMLEAKKNGGVYDRRIAIRKIREDPNEEKLKRQMIAWNETNLNTLIDAGYMTKQSPYIYIANPLAYDIQKKDFVPGKNHAKLLNQHNGGIVRSSELKQKYDNKPLEEQKRQKKFIDGMLRTLAENGYIERMDKGEYKITDKGHEFIIKIKQSPPAKRNNKQEKGFTVTGFDRCISDVIVDGKVDEALLNVHKRADTVKKRLETFKKNNLISEKGIASDECLKLLEKALEISKSEMLSIDKLTQEQLQLVKDMRLFLNLSKHQIVKHIYKGNSKLADTDMEFLIRKKVLKKDDNFCIYIMDKVGISLSNSLFPNAVKYGTKLHSRKEEVEHDMLVYSAYHSWVKDIVAKGGRIIEIKNDRQLRSEDAKKYGYMKGSYPDLRVFYKMPGSNRLQKYDIEVDCGYDGKTIDSKVHGLTGTFTKSQFSTGTYANSHLGWYCKTIYQAMKVINTITKDTTKVSRMNVARKMTVNYMDKDGNFQKVSHAHWDK